MHNEQIEKAVLSEINPEMDQRKSAKQADRDQQSIAFFETLWTNILMPATDLKTENAGKAFLRKSNPDQLAHLKRRLDEAAKQQPEIISLRQRLLSLGGVELVAPPTTDILVSFLIDYGRIMPGPVKFKRMQASGCHENVAKLWFAGKCDLIGTGYALNDDGLWRQHTWGIRREGILETTIEREKYFGLMLRAGGAFAFANMHSH